MKLRAQEVFTPGAFPNHTYVERGKDRLEQAVRDGIDTPGLVVSLSGPSKSGKTVLVERVVERDLLITVTGAGISSPDDIWNSVLDWMGAPSSASKGTSLMGGAAVEAGGEVGGSAFGLVKATGSTKGELSVEAGREDSTHSGRRGLAQVVEEIANSDFVILIDDFHYMPRDVQTAAAKSIKEAVRQGLKICTASVLHRGDDVVRANPELRGRVKAVDLDYWGTPDLLKIATTGFDRLNALIDPSTINALIKESAGSPQLMQLLCLNTCLVLGLREKVDEPRLVPVTAEQLRAIFEQTSSSTDFRSLVDVIDAGPRVRGVERKMYKFKDGSEGDVYRCVLRAVAADPPRLSFQYDELLRRTSAMCNGDAPVGSSVTGTCLHMSRLALSTFPGERALDWDESKQVLDIPDPYLLFYLRWSGRLQEP